MEQSSINVFERISAEYYNLTTAEKKAADYVLSHQRKAQDMSITELAAASGVAEATVSRFCRRLGCKGYNAFRLAIANSIAQRPQQSNPLSGEVLEVNQKVVDAPETVNEDPYGDGWLIRIRMTSADERETLLDVAAYKNVVAEG